MYRSANSTLELLKFGYKAANCSYPSGHLLQQTKTEGKFSLKMPLLPTDFHNHKSHFVAHFKSPNTGLATVM